MFHEKPVEMLSKRHIVRRLLNVGETDLYLGVEVDTVYKWSRVGVLSKVKLGGALRFDVNVLDRFIEQYSTKTIDYIRRRIMSVHKKAEGLFEVRWRQEGRQKSVRIRGFDVAKKVQHKKLTNRDENRHLDVKKEINYKMSDLIDRYWTHYGSKKASADREKSIVEGIRSELGREFVREVDGIAVQHWYENLTGKRGLADNTAVRHFNGMHHMMEKASTI
jgi:hypothetical protein